MAIPLLPGDPRRYIDRQQATLEYHARVLSIAADKELPLLERAKFLAIFTTNLDEFFRVRVAGIREQLEAGVGTTSREGRTPTEQLAAIRDRYRGLSAEHSRIFRDEVRPSLAAEGVEIVDWADLTDEELARLDDLFDKRIMPVLTPLAVDPAHPFPFISDLSLNLAVQLRYESGEEGFARLKVPLNLNRFFRVPSTESRFVALESMIGHHLDRMFPGVEIVEHHEFRVTRNADYDVEEEEAADLLEVIESELLKRRFGRVVRLEIQPDMPDRMRRFLQAEMGVDSEDVYVVDAPLDLGGLWGLYDLERSDLKAEHWRPVDVPAFDVSSPRAFFEVIRERDVFVHHPYDSFESSVQRFIEHAADDPRVLAIKQTLYRTSSDSPVVRALKRAAESGKQAVALIELKARFDEEANIRWAREMEEAGVHVVYGFVELKTHTKIALVVREDEDGKIRGYGHIGTGNYNPRTAQIYEDVGLFTADPELTLDLVELFNYLTGHSQQDDYRKLLVAPVTLRDRLSELIGQQAHAEGHIVMKVNNLIDTRLIDDLYAASQAGCRVDLIVRSICALKPGVPGLSENIRVRSIVGRFLEHSRIFRFGQDPEPGHYLIGSADVMPRNLDRRVEAVAPVDDGSLRDRLDEILEVYLSDDHLAWEQVPEGGWRRVEPRTGIDAQRRFMQLARARRRR